MKEIIEDLLFVLNGHDILNFESWNPFKEQVDATYPMAKIYSNSLLQAFIDTFDRIVGNHYELYNSDKRGSIGIIDYLIFPLLTRQLAAYTYKADGEPRSAIILGIIGILEIPRIALGLLLTLAVSPFVAAVSLYSYFKRKSFDKIIDELTVKELDPPNEYKIARGEHIFHSLHTEGVEGKFRTYKGRFGGNPKIAAYFRGEKLSLLIFGYDKPLLIDVKEENAKAIHALINANKFNSFYNLKGQGVLKKIKNQLEAPKAARDTFAHVINHFESCCR